jgi:hypothetical protein
MTMLDAVGLWGKHAAKLGALERDKLIHVTKPIPVDPSAISELRARGAWLSVVTTVLDVLHHSKAAEELKARISGPVEEASAKALQRYLDAHKPREPPPE